ncbi:MAG TPA: hypothetical protein VMF89_33485, partial [Polyangiales bacterium]|nr:hypothetical protein [Polyangiales bacterium]
QEAGAQERSRDLDLERSRLSLQSAMRVDDVPLPLARTHRRERTMFVTAESYEGQRERLRDALEGVG